MKRANGCNCPSASFYQFTSVNMCDQKYVDMFLCVFLSSGGVGWRWGVIVILNEQRKTAGRKLEGHG